jgi:hypothetical protein
VKSALLLLSQTDGGEGPKNHLRGRADVADLLIAELRARRRRLRRLLRLLDSQVRRKRRAALPAGRCGKASGSVTRPLRIA